MSRILYIGDEAQAAAWRLLGVAVRVAAADADVERWIAAAGADAARSAPAADLILLAPSAAARLSPAALERARRALKPQLLVLPTASAIAAGSELARRVRSQLGMES